MVILILTISYIIYSYAYYCILNLEWSTFYLLLYCEIVLLIQNYSSSIVLF